jgi:hypothetical protein
MLHFIENWSNNLVHAGKSAICKIVSLFTSMAHFSYDILSENIDDLNLSFSLKERMTRYIQEDNSKKCHYFKPHIVSLKSKNLLTHFNLISKLDDKLEIIKQHNKMLERVCSSLYLKFDPYMIYAFDNEIHLVFYPNETGIYLYDSDIMKTVTNIVSYASICLTKEMNAFCYEIECIFEGNLVEFGKDYEVLNYIVWRQLDCKRNTITLLYKCINYPGTVTLDKVALLELENEVRANVSDDVLEKMLYGIICKKQIVYIETESKSFCWKKGEQLCDEDSSELVMRKQMSVLHTPLWVNFRSNLKKYVINKHL